MNEDIKKNLLLLAYDKNNYFEKITENRGYTVENAYWGTNIFLKIIRKILVILNLGAVSIFMGRWKKELSNKKVVIIHASKLTAPIVKYINKKKSLIRVIVWFWNPVSRNYRVEDYKNLNCELWSFNEVDCKKYGMHYNTQYYFRDILIKEEKKKFDVIFAGADKGRMDILKKIDNEFRENNISRYFYVVGRTGNDVNFVHRQPINYKEILNIIKKSYSILEINQKGQDGLTLRSLEAVFHNRKLITNNENIKNYEFYNKNNIFVLNKDGDINDLKKFIESPLKSYSKEIKKYYDFDQWLYRFF